MLINGKSLNSSTTYLDTYRQMRTIAGNASWFTEFRPVRFPARETIHLLLLEFFHRHILICSFLSGSFVCFIAGILNSFKAASIYVVLTTHPLCAIFFKEDLKLFQISLSVILIFYSLTQYLMKIHSFTKLLEVIFYAFLFFRCRYLFALWKIF
jgi:hypothetical protein